MKDELRANADKRERWAEAGVGAVRHTRLDVASDTRRTGREREGWKVEVRRQRPLDRAATDWHGIR